MTWHYVISAANLWGAPHYTRLGGRSRGRIGFSLTLPQLDLATLHQ